MTNCSGMHEAFEYRQISDTRPERVRLTEYAKFRNKDRELDKHRSYAQAHISATKNLFNPNN